MAEPSDVHSVEPALGTKSGSQGKKKQPIRLFTCNTCYQKLRFGSVRCGQCWQPAPLLNQRRFYIATGTALVLAVLAVYARGN